MNTNVRLAHHAHVTGLRRKEYTERSDEQLEREVREYEEFRQMPFLKRLETYLFDLDPPSEQTYRWAKDEIEKREKEK